VDHLPVSRGNLQGSPDNLPAGLGSLRGNPDSRGSRGSPGNPGNLLANRRDSHQVARVAKLGARRAAEGVRPRARPRLVVVALDGRDSLSRSHLAGRPRPAKVFCSCHAC
jgi:hypothetical protein